jgi:prevent-host-death family protein
MVGPIDLYEAKRHLSSLVDRAAAGEEIIISKSGTPLARLMPLELSHPDHRPGALRPGLRIADDFDPPFLPGIV